MTTAYWNQWSHAEIMSMHGVELDDIEEEQEEIEIDVEEEQRCCSGCMSCLGLSIRDFL